MLPDCVYFPSYSVKCISCFMLRHLMMSWCLNFARNGEIEEGGVGRVSRNGEVAILYWDFSGDSSWCSMGKQSWCVHLFFVNKHVLKNNCLNKIWDDWYCNSFNSVDNYNSCNIYYVSSKYFYLMLTSMPYK